MTVSSVSQAEIVVVSIVLLVFNLRPKIRQLVL